jgi:hypothetical protein
MLTEGTARADKAAAATAREAMESDFMKTP